MRSFAASGIACSVPQRPSFGASLKAYLAPLVFSSALGAYCIHEILGRASEPAVPLDDAFIHFQYARRLAEGSFFAYTQGGGYTSGATSILWPLLLAPFYKLGFRGLSIIPIAWLFGTLAHAALTLEIFRFAHRLAGRAAALGAAAMSLGFGAFAWFAWSGMESIPFAWMMTRTFRLCAEWCDEPITHWKASPDAAHRSSRALFALCAFGLLTPLMRPEGGLVSIAAAASIAAFPARLARPRFARAFALIPLAGPAIVPSLHWVMKGHGSSSTAMVKWFFLNPAYDTNTKISQLLINIQMLVRDLLNGGDYTTLFVPSGLIVFLLAGLAFLPWIAHLRNAPFHALFAAIFALGSLIPCSYMSLLWNRVRYTWPFAPAFFVLLAALAQFIADLAARRRRDLSALGPLIAGLFAGAFAAKLSWSSADLAQSAAAIDQQQVLLGRWAHDHLPKDALIGLNDTGALAYLSERQTFDVVGLTTEGEAPYWVAGAGSRFEHYEKMPAEKRPTHFIVYPGWMACPAVLGRELTRATVLDQSILGSPTMVAYEADYSLLGSGEAPFLKVPGQPIDKLDIADLESEAEHGYSRLFGFDVDCRVRKEPPPLPEGAPDERGDERPDIADGGRFNRRKDAFLAHLLPNRPALFVMRLAADEDASVRVSANGQALSEIEIESGPWVEKQLEIPAAQALKDTLIVVESVTSQPFHSFHYWFYALPSTP